MFITRRMPLYAPDEGGGGNQAPVEGTPESPDPAGTPGTGQQETVDWQKRYTDLQPEYTRASQEAAEYRQLVSALQSDDQDTRHAAAEHLGIEFADEDEPDEYNEDDPYTAYEQRIARVEEYLSTRDQEAQQTAAQERDFDHIGDRFDQIEKEVGRELSDEEQRLLFSFAVQNRDEQGRPDVEAGWNHFQSYEAASKQRWANTKNAPRFSPVGQSATQQPDLDNSQGRSDYIRQRLQDSGQ